MEAILLNAAGLLTGNGGCWSLLVLPGCKIMGATWSDLVLIKFQDSLTQNLPNHVQNLPSLHTDGKRTPWSSQRSFRRSGRAIPIEKPDASQAAKKRIKEAECHKNTKIFSEKRSHDWLHLYRITTQHLNNSSRPS